MKIWITGICGFLGSHLAVEMFKRDHKIRGNDNLQFAETDPMTIAHESGMVPEGFHLVDCCDFKNLKNYMEPAINPPDIRCDVLYHCAATAHEGLSNFSPSFVTRNIYEASVATFSAAIAAGVKRIIFMSSMARYGDGHYSQMPPFRETYETRPKDPYGIAKVAAEETLKALCRLHGVQYVIAVPHNIIGPRQRFLDPYRNVASIMINRALMKKPIIVYGDGQQKRCFSPVRDCIDSLVKMIDAPVTGEVINIGPDRGEITIMELAEMVRDLTGGSAEIMHVKARPNEVREAYCSSDKARRLLGYTEQQPLRACLEEMVAYIDKQHSIHGHRPSIYNIPIEIEHGCPETWTKELI